jgi:transforming growth factor-beta-induced protein
MERLNLIDTAIRSGVFHTFTRLLEGSSLEEKLRSQEQFTLFAPVDIAFACLGQDTFNGLLRAENQGVLGNVLGYHAVPMKIMFHELKGMGKARTVYGPELLIDDTAELRVDEARLLHVDILACNGVIHGIDRLLMPVKAAGAASR